MAEKTISLYCFDWLDNIKDKEIIAPEIEKPSEPLEPVEDKAIEPEDTNQIVRPTIIEPREKEELSTDEEPNDDEEKLV